MGVVTPERERTAPPPERQPPEPPPKRPLPWGLIAVGVLVLAIWAAPGFVRDLLPSFPNPFGTETVDRSQPALLRSLQDLREFRAASGHFEVIVDLEKDTALPSELLGERTLLVAAGQVDASVDFAGVGEDAVAVSDDRRSATITLPRPRLSDARLDLERSYVYDRQQGVLNEIGLLFQDERDTEREAYLLAEAKLDDAAADGSGLVERAEANTRTMLESLLRALGFSAVEVRFE